MARIRSIKPEFFTSERMALLDHTDRLLFVGLWTHVDDEGRCIDNPVLIRNAVFPLDDLSAERVQEGLRRLQELGRLERYTVAERRYLCITTWEEHQKISHPSKSKFPGPEQGQETFEKPPEKIVSPPEALRPDQGTGKGKEQGAGNGSVRLSKEERTLTISLAAAAIAQRRGKNDEARDKSNPGSWLASAIRGIGADIGEQANALLTSNPALTPDDLAEILEPRVERRQPMCGVCMRENPTWCGDDCPLPPPAGDTLADNVFEINAIKKASNG